MDKAKEARDLTDDVAARRKQELADNFPPLKREDFASPEEYRDALLAQYRQLRQQEYEDICLSEAVIGFDACVRNGNSNVDIWKCRGELADSSACQKVKEILPKGCQNYGEHRTTIRDKNGNIKVKHGEYCCAAYACGYEAAVCEKMGIEGLIKVDVANTGAANLAPFSKDQKISGKNKNDLWKLIEEGKIGPGDQISHYSTGNTSSGKHAELIVAVNYDENGKLKSYVVHGNNASKLQVIDANTQFPPIVTKKVNGKTVKLQSFTVGRMNTWMGEQLDREAEGLYYDTKGLSPEEIKKLEKELEDKVAAQRAKVGAEIDGLEQAERHLFGLRAVIVGNSAKKKIDNYADNYIKNADVPSATPAVMHTDAQNATDESARREEQLRNEGASKEKDTRSTRRTAMFHRSTSADNTRSSSAVKAEQPLEVPAEKRIVRSDVISERDKKKMKSMMTNLNKGIKKDDKFDIDGTIDKLVELYGADAAKVLTKIMMAPAHFTKNMDLKDENGKPIKLSSRAVLEQLCKIDNEKQNQQVLAIAVTKKRGRGDMA